MAPPGKVLHIRPGDDNQRQLNLLSRELQHRIKNIIANVRAVARLTYDDSNDLDGFYEAFDGRLQCLSRFQSFIGITDKPVDLKELLAEEFLAYAAHIDREVDVAGPDLLIEPRAAQTFALAFHELVTNAIKFGALSHDAGHITVHWKIQKRDDEDYLILDWRESGGTVDRDVGPTGFGRRLIEEALPYEVGGTTRFELPHGELHCVMEIPFSDRIRRAEATTIPFRPVTPS
jgi:two-component system CheB/CheR fusion protein